MVDTFTFNSVKPTISSFSINDRIVAGDESGGSYTLSFGSIGNLFSSSVYSNIQASGSGGVTLKTSGGTTVAQWGGGGSNAFAVNNILQVTGETRANGGISFDSGANTLSDYVEQTFTASIISSSGGSANISSQACTSTLIGNRCFVTFQVALTDKGTLAAGALRLSGLPYACASANDTAIMYAINVNTGLSYSSPLMVKSRAGATQVDFVNITPDSIGTISVSEIDANFSFLGSFSYEV